MAAHKPKVVVAMSGGVDSSVAAALLLRQGYDVVGVFMRLGSPAGVLPPEACDTGQTRQGCCSVLDADDARRVAAVLGIPLYVLNFQDDFGRVIDYFVDEYNRGRTPNPCVRCNDWLKFGKLAAYAHAVGADFVATGHYARIGRDPLSNAPALCRGLDQRKDQSYVLFGMRPQALTHTLLPIGDYRKTAVRQMALDLKLPVHNKPDSQEICFVPNQDYASLLQCRSPDAFRPGKIVDKTGQTLGEHPGYQHFTVGQRRGVGLALGRPVYVLSVDPAGNRVTVGSRDDLLRRSLIARQTNWHASRTHPTNTPIRCTAKIRYNHTPQPATATITGPDEFRLDFDLPQHAITPGQAAVLYDDDVLLGGGWIDHVLPDEP